MSPEDLSAVKSSRSCDPLVAMQGVFWPVGGGSTLGGHSSIAASRYKKKVKIFKNLADLNKMEKQTTAMGMCNIKTGKIAIVKSIFSLRDLTSIMKKAAN